MTRESHLITRSVALFLSVLLVAGCFSSSYVPRNDGRVSMVIENGNSVYRRDGRNYKSGIFFGELEQAVKGVPAAEKAARKFRRRVGPGFVASVAGVVCATVAFGFVDSDSDALNRRSKIALATSAACATGSIIGSLIFASGVPYQADAINLFNDSIAPAGQVYLPGQARSSASSTISTRPCPSTATDLSLRPSAASLLRGAP